MKIAVILAIVVLAFTIGHGSLANFTQSAVTFSGGYAPVFLAFIIAMSGAFWAYDGWINLTYLAGEIKNPQKNLPRAMIIAAVVFISVYLLINLAYFYIIPVQDMGSKVPGRRKPPANPTWWPPTWPLRFWATGAAA